MKFVLFLPLYFAPKSLAASYLPAISKIDADFFFHLVIVVRGTPCLSATLASYARRALNPQARKRCMRRYVFRNSSRTGRERKSSHNQRPKQEVSGKDVEVKVVVD